MKLRNLIGAAVVSAGIANAYAEDGWLNITGSVDGYHYDLKEGSLREENGHAIIIARFVNERTQDIAFRRLSVSFQDCKREMGQVERFDMEGRKVGASDFVFNGDNVASGIAMQICNLDYFSYGYVRTGHVNNGLMK